jgi:hypothetical protein
MEKHMDTTMDKQKLAKSHTEAAQHHEKAAKHHQEAAKHQETGDHVKAAHEAQVRQLSKQPELNVNNIKQSAEDIQGVQQNTLIAFRFFLHFLKTMKYA